MTHLLGSFVTCSALLGLVLAQDCPPAKVRVTVLVILASEDGNTVDKRLTAIAQEVQTKEPKLKSFKLKCMECKSIAKDEKADFMVCDTKSVQVVAKTCASKNNKVCLAVTAPDQGEIVYESVCGKFLPIVTRHQTKNKERVILAIRVQPCKGE